jgi:hypothetical protein
MIYSHPITVLFLSVHELVFIYAYKNRSCLVEDAKIEVFLPT